MLQHVLQGVGLSVHGTFRVATERTLFAMPETAIGKSWCLNTCHVYAHSSVIKCFVSGELKKTILSFKLF